MLKIFAAILLAGPLTACATDAIDASEGTDFPTADQAAKHADPLPPIGEDQEYSFFQGQTHTFSFPGFFSPQAETFFIWNFGTTIQHGAPPGPSFNAATFDAPLSEHDINKAVADGVLAAPITTTAAGFGPLVITVPVTKFKDHGH